MDPGTNKTIDGIVIELVDCMMDEARADTAEVCVSEEHATLRAAEMRADEEGRTLTVLRYDGS